MKDKKEFYLCYIDENKAYFTSNWEKQDGDDWNDKPYECNAGDPYKYDYSAPEMGVEDGRGIYPEIELKELYFEFQYWVKVPSDSGSFSVDEINRGDIAWLRGDDFNIHAKTTYEDFKKIVKEHGGTLYLKEGEADE